MAGIIISLWLIGLTLFTIIEPVIGPMAYYLIVWMHPERQMYGGGIQLRWTMVIAATSLLGYLFLGKRREAPKNALVFFLILFAVWYLVTAQFNATSEAEFALATDFLKVVLMCLITACIINTRLRLHAMIWIIVISIGSVTFRSGLVVALTGGGAVVIGPEFLGHTNEYARAIIYTLPLMLFLARHSAKNYVRWGHATVAAFSVLALIGTNSRGGFVAFAAMCAVAWLYGSKKVISIVLGVILAAGAYMIIPEKRQQSFTSRATTIERADEDNSFNNRVEAWIFGWNYALEHPVMGGGPGVYERIFNRASHNSYFEVVGESGFVGLGLFLIIAALAIKTIFSIRRRTRNIPDLRWAYDLSFFILLSLVGYFVGGLTKNHGFFEYYYMLIGLLMGTEIAVRKHLAALASRPVEVSASHRAQAVSAG